MFQKKVSTYLLHSDGPTERKWRGDEAGGRGGIGGHAREQGRLVIGGHLAQSTPVAR